MKTRIKQKIIIVVGPTASGKTDLAIRLAKKLARSRIKGFRGAEIISADSRQIYRGMDIGTAKPRLVEKGRALFSAGIRHHLIDIRNIGQPFSAKDFKTLAEKAIRDIARRKKLPIVAGGTGLYIKTLVENLNLTATPPDARLRKKLESELKARGLTYLYSKLVKLDPEAAYIVDPKNPRRVIRALEIALTSKKPLSIVRESGKPPFHFLEIGTDIPREKLKSKIERRVVTMVKNGLIAEVKKLIRAYGKNREPLSAIGYREIISHLEGKTALAEAVRQIQINTWRYAQKQIAWFKKDPKVLWVKTKREAEKAASAFLDSPL